MMTRNELHSILLSAFALAASLSAPSPAPAQDAKQPYATMAPPEQYLMDRDAEIALARSVLPYAYKRTELLLAGHSKPEVIAAIKAAIDKKELPALEPGTVCYMMSKSSYLTDNGGHNGPHLMFYESLKDDAAWGANMPNSPVLSVNY